MHDRLMCLFLAAIALACCATARAQTGDAASGRSIYASWCVGCHNADPKLDAHGVINGAGNANFILNEWSIVPDMQFLLQGALPDPVQAAADVAAYLASLGGSGTTAPAVEYYYAAWDFYFVTAFPEEIAALDAGAFGGVWKRTGQTFNVWPQGNASASPTCRFFTVAFAPQSSHFYTPFPGECATVKTYPAWQYEAVAFYIALADAGGWCAAGTIPLYRLYNAGMGGAPNHRYTTSLAILDQMLGAGWLFEGDGNTKVFACVPQ